MPNLGYNSVDRLLLDPAIGADIGVSQKCFS